MFSHIAKIERVTAMNPFQIRSQPPGNCDAVRASGAAPQSRRNRYRRSGLIMSCANAYRTGEPEQRGSATNALPSRLRLYRLSPPSVNEQRQVPIYNVSLRFRLPPTSS
jgi:hypothetical protein